ncbi:hypothetical protein SAY87_021897 [Trapa incisa]|uniref:Peptidase C14 caspase domain-containing protein n=1 Tax=Trapa incisa TaxID=236973 RepID=A0AAN7JSJ2_9MYRT|nr:hypothetical protein SAY87_021897 [Trapa incisa]
MAKKAVLIGCNYPGTKAELKGCINDVKRMYRCLTERYGFSDEDITVLIDADESYVQPTGKNICRAPRRSHPISRARRSPLRPLHWSRHPPPSRDWRGGRHRLRRASGIVNSDKFQQAKEQIGESTKREEEEESSGFGFKSFLHQKVQDAFESHGVHVPSGLLHHQRNRHDEEGDREVEIASGEYGYVKNKSLPLQTLIDILKQKTGKEDIGVGELRPTLFDMFGDDASPKVKKFMKVIFDKLQSRFGEEGEGSGGGGGFLGMVGGLAQEFLKHTKPAMEVEVGSKQEVYAGATKRSFPGGEILISGCQTDQTSADASPSGNAQAA